MRGLDIFMATDSRDFAFSLTDTFDSVDHHCGTFYNLVTPSCCFWTFFCPPLSGGGRSDGVWSQWFLWILPPIDLGSLRSCLKSVNTNLGPHLSLWIHLFSSCFVCTHFSPPNLRSIKAKSEGKVYVYTLSDHGIPWFMPFVKTGWIGDTGAESVNYNVWMREETEKLWYVVNLKINVNPLCTCMQH